MMAEDGCSKESEINYLLDSYDAGVEALYIMDFKLRAGDSMLLARKVNEMRSKILALMLQGAVHE